MPEYEFHRIAELEEEVSQLKAERDAFVRLVKRLAWETVKEFGVKEWKDLPEATRKEIES